MENQENNFSFNPNLNLLRIGQRKIRRILSWLLYLSLMLFGLLGIAILFLYPNEFMDIFYLSLLSDMFLFYLYQRRKEKVRKIRLPKEGEELEVSLFLNEESKKLLEKSWALAYRKGFPSLRPIHFFSVFSKEKSFKKIIKRLNCELGEISQKTERILKISNSEGVGKKNVLGISIATDFRNAVLNTYLFCLENQKEQISPLDILWGISQQENLVGMVFDEFGISPQEIEKVIEWAHLEEIIKKSEREFFWRRLFKPKGKLNRTMTAALTPLLDKASQDLTYLARQGEFELIVGREKEIEEIFNFFSSGKTGVILVGESEIGKKSILKKLAQMMIEEKVPKFLRDKRLVELDLGALVGLGGGQKTEEHLRQIIFEVNRAGNIILVIENIDSMVGLKSQASGLDLSEILSSAIEGQALFFIGTSLPEGYANKVEDKILGRVLSKIEIVLPSGDFLWKILITKIHLIEKRLKIFFSADALEQAIDLSDRYVYGKALPSKTIDLLSEVGYLVSGRKGRGSVVRGEDIVEAMARKTKIPLGQIGDLEKEKLLQLEELIHQRLINQEEAVKAVASAMRRSRLDTKKRKKPIANFLFIGPTGVGKTELSKTLAAVYFGDERRMIRLDMSEYQEKRGLRRLIGLRGEEGISRGYLTEAIKRQPYSLVLLDEIEKAHPDILNLFLQVMDDGRLTDASGETINFTNVILIGTSNAGTQFIQQKIAKNTPYEKIYEELKEEVLLEHFRPEFLNRFDKIVLFKSLSMDNMRDIAMLFIKALNKRIEEKGVKVEVEKEALEELSAMGYDPLYGARPLIRVIQEKLEDTLAKMFLEDKIKRRDKVLVKKNLIFEIIKAREI
ncbi:MAG: ATP-dependent Clp protease ATP-binding subunit [Candidatus Portnoybacteria bacterium]